MTSALRVIDPEACSPASTATLDVEVARTLSDTLKALADPLRLRMLSAVATDPRGESCVCDLTALADVSQPTVSHHLRVLKGTGLLTSERRGTWVWYRIADARRGAVSALLDLLAPAALAEVPAVPRLSGEDLLGMDARLTNLAGELVATFPDLAVDLVVATVRESFTALARSATVTAHLISLTEQFARQRLQDMRRDRTDGVTQVLFVCVQNAGRSQLAAALLNQRSTGRVRARSAGSTPAAVVHPHVRSLLVATDGEDAAERSFPKPLTDDAVRAADIVITMGCGDVCPVIPGVRYEDWPVADPALATEDGLAAIRNDISERIDALLSSLTQPKARSAR